MIVKTYSGNGLDKGEKVKDFYSIMRLERKNINNTAIIFRKYLRNKCFLRYNLKKEIPFLLL
jgi:hypothetical protein